MSCNFLSMTCQKRYNLYILYVYLMLLSTKHSGHLCLLLSKKYDDILPSELKYNGFHLFKKSKLYRDYRTVFVKNLKCLSLSLSLSAYLFIHFYWLSWLKQASHRKLIQNSALRLRLRRFKILTCPLLQFQNVSLKEWLSFMKSPEPWRV